MGPWWMSWCLIGIGHWFHHLVAFFCWFNEFNGSLNHQYMKNHESFFFIVKSQTSIADLPTLHSGTSSWIEILKTMNHSQAFFYFLKHTNIWTMALFVLLKKKNTFEPSIRGEIFTARNMTYAAKRSWIWWLEELLKTVQLEVRG